jgi:broad specificity phosphatase PhoE
MKKLILIKHASPQVVPGTPPEQWKLSAQGRASCATLGERLRIHAPRLIVSSTEPKAVETGQLISEALKIPAESAPDLHEHDRSNVPHMRSSEFISSMELFFRRPDELVLGNETAREAEERFTAAVEAVLSAHQSSDSIAIVSHGTVIALLLARRTNRPAFQLWREWGLPSFAVLELPECCVIETVAKV